jgi:hypothetical protein
VSSVRYEMGFYIPEDGVLHSHRRENLKSNIILDQFLKAYLFFHRVIMKFCEP